jgi:putative ABC transport system permease protein
VLWSYIKIAWKVLLRRKFFTAVSLFGIAFTLTVLLLAAAVHDHTFAPHPPEVNARRTLIVERVEAIGENVTRHGPIGYPFHDQVVRPLPEVEAVSIQGRPRRVTSYPEGREVSMEAKLVDAAFWRVFEFTFVEGGPFTEADGRDGRLVAVISESARERYFGGGEALGRDLEIEGRPFRVVGVVENVARIRLLTWAEVWVPIGSQSSSRYLEDMDGYFSSVILARNRADMPRIKEQFRQAVASMEMPPGSQYQEIYSTADTLFEAAARAQFGSTRGDHHAGRLWALMALGTVLFMLLPALNLVNLNVSRILERGPEIGIRKAFGASSGSLVLQFLVENLFVTFLGGALALVAAAALLHAFNESGFIPYASFHLNLRIFFWGVGLALVFGILSGVWPAWKMSRMKPADVLSGRR